MPPNVNRYTEFEVDLSDVIECEFCGAAAGELCHTIAGVPTTRTHACRRVLIPSSQDHSC